jgi:pimeloyl-ACP methyl ester carboxylesterase
MAEDGYADQFVSAADGLKLYARDYGPRLSPSLPVICLPGLARTSADFHELALALSRDEKRPRRVLALDYRGRGRSDYDRDWRNYDLKVELDDILQVVTVAGVTEAAVVGTSRGGLLAMALSARRPTLLRGVVLNDIGPVIDSAGLVRIRGYVGKLPSPRHFAEGGQVLKQLFQGQFPRQTDAEWEAQARTTWKEADGRLVVDYDPQLRRILDALDPEQPVPPLWFLFASLRRFPVLVLRGANSDLLSEQTLQAMADVHPDLEAVTVPDQGHVPALRGREIVQCVQRFVARVEGDANARPSSAPMDVT